MSNLTRGLGLLLSLVGFLSSGQGAFADDQYQVGCDNYSKGDYGAAKAAFQEALKSRSRTWQVHYQLANTLVQLKDSVAARAEYQQTLALTTDAGVKAQCQSAIRYLTINKTLPAAEPERPKPTIIKPGEEDDDDPAPAPAPVPAQTSAQIKSLPTTSSSAEDRRLRALKAQKEQIIQTANYEVEKIRREIAAQIQRDSDREKEIKSSGDARIEKILQEARDKAEQVH